MLENLDPLLLMGRLLVQEGVVTEEKLEAVVLNQIGHRALRWPGRSLGHHLIAANAVTADVLEGLLNARDSRPVPAGEIRLGELAVRNGFLKGDQLAACLAEQKAQRARAGTPLRLGKIMLRDKLVWEHDLQALLDRQRALLESAGRAALEDAETQEDSSEPSRAGEPVGGES